VFRGERKLCQGTARARGGCDIYSNRTARQSVVGCLRKKSNHDTRIKQLAPSSPAPRSISFARRPAAAPLNQGEEEAGDPGHLCHHTRHRKTPFKLFFSSSICFTLVASACITDRYKFLAALATFNLVSPRITSQFNVRLDIRKAAKASLAFTHAEGLGLLSLPRRSHLSLKTSRGVHPAFTAFTEKSTHWQVVRYVHGTTSTCGPTGQCQWEFVPVLGLCGRGIEH